MDKTEENKIKEKLTNNINTYLQNNNLTVSDKETLDSFITEMTQIYKDNITLYGMIDNYAGMFSKIGHLINIAVLMLVITIIILVILLILIKGNGYETILTASGIMLLFVKFIIYDRIDYNNIVIISDSFSKVLNYILNNIGILMIIFGLLLTIVGILTAVIKLLKKK